jgi:hypothetical protein
MPRGRPAPSRPPAPPYFCAPSNSTTTRPPTRKSTRPTKPRESWMSTWACTSAPAARRARRVSDSPGDSLPSSAAATAARARATPPRVPGWSRADSIWVRVHRRACSAASIDTTPALTPLAAAVSTHAVATSIARGCAERRSSSVAANRWTWRPVRRFVVVTAAATSRCPRSTSWTATPCRTRAAWCDATQVGLASSTPSVEMRNRSHGAAASHAPAEAYSPRRTRRRSPAATAWARSSVVSPAAAARVVVSSGGSDSSSRARSGSDGSASRVPAPSDLRCPQPCRRAGSGADHGGGVEEVLEPRGAAARRPVADQGVDASGSVGGMVARED